MPLDRLRQKAICERRKVSVHLEHGLCFFVSAVLLFRKLVGRLLGHPAVGGVGVLGLLA